MTFPAASAAAADQVVAHAAVHFEVPRPPLRPPGTNRTRVSPPGTNRTRIYPRPTPMTAPPAPLPSALLQLLPDDTGEAPAPTSPILRDSSPPSY